MATMPNYGLVYNQRTSGSATLDTVIRMIKLDPATGLLVSGPIDHPISGSQYKIIQRPVKWTTDPSPIYVISDTLVDTIYYLT